MNEHFRPPRGGGVGGWGGGWGYDPDPNIILVRKFTLRNVFTSLPPITCTLSIGFQIKVSFVLNVHCKMVGLTGAL